MSGHGNQALSVSAVAQFLSNLVKENLSSLWIRGEVSNLRVQPNGNTFFSLKDDSAKINCLLMKFKPARSMVSELKDGMEILVNGNLSYYVKEGYITFFVDEIELVGEGLLKKKFEELKQRLEKEGLFDKSRKKSIPSYPNRVGVVTGASTAAFQDILNVTARRFKSVSIVLFPASVQGEKASGEIARAIRVANRYAAPYIDVLIVARGGGSLEDLWCFNEEGVARAIADSEIPVISAVGHEIDYTIADYVADLRAPTPSAAAELVLKDRTEIIQYLRNLSNRMDQILENKLETSRLILQNKGEDALRRSLETQLSDISFLMENLKVRFNSHRQSFIRELKDRIQLYREKLETLHPYHTLARGYSISYRVDEKGQRINLMDSGNVKSGDHVHTILHQGEFDSTVD